ncbi:MAG: hypothetical protein VX818_01595 [Candidatus Neomarinimicrobiota bacterium]|nr:hypothetical protein [Candidatus Neomarinimicrobiota bacterium]
MFPRKKYYQFLIILSSFVYSQDVYSAYGIGELLLSHNASVIGAGSTGLMPNFQKNVSLSNPSTWTDMPFAYISINYGGLQIIDKINNRENILSGLHQFQFILPIKGKYAIGISFQPYSSQLYSLYSNNTDIKYIEQDTINFNSYLNGGGGISDLSFSLSARFSKTEKGALKFNYLFGSSRNQISYSMNDGDNGLDDDFDGLIDEEGENDINYIYNQRNIYDGTLISGYFSSNRINIGKRKLTISASFNSVFNSFRVKNYSFYPFEDVNNNGYYDLSDYPTPAGNDSIPPTALKYEYKKLFIPSQYAIGLNLEMSDLLNLQAELSNWSDLANGENNVLSNLNYQLTDYQHFNISAIRFARALPRYWYESLHFRSGLFVRKYNLKMYATNETDFNQYDYNDIGLSIGVGIKFGLTKNQLDFGLNLINRSDSINNDKFITNFNIGLTIGDIWFVKRRAK